MESCSQCSKHQWFVERSWDMSKQDAQFRVICKGCGFTGYWDFSEEDAIKMWNKRQKEVRELGL